MLSTLHTNDAANAVTRLADIGVEGFKIGTSLRGVVAQRLMRTLCTSCREERSEPVAPKLHRWIPDGSSLQRAVGCPECAMTGYRGRFSIVEILKITPAIERLITSGATADKIADAASAEGMRSMWHSGLAHVTRGESTIEELLRVVDMPQDDEVKSGDVPARASGGAGPARESSGGESAPVGVVSPAVATTLPDRLVDRFELVDGVSTVEEAGDGGAGIRVLLVDDENQLRRVMRDLLERDGYTVFEAKDGAQALEQVDTHAPDILVLDLNLPGLDGYGVITQLRSRQATADLPIIVLTAKGDEDNEVRVFELGADDFLSKPFRARALSARIQAVLARTRR